MPSAYFGRVRIPWHDVDAVVAWHLHGDAFRVGVIASPAYRARKRLDRGGAAARWLDREAGAPVSGTVQIWNGPQDAIIRLGRFVSAVAPHIPLVDPMDGVEPSAGSGHTAW